MIEALHALLIANADKLPFVMLSQGGNSKLQLSVQGIIEAAVIATLLAGIGYIAIIPRLEERMSLEFRNMRDDVMELKSDVRVHTDGHPRRIEQQISEVRRRLDKLEAK